jgi:ribosomal protein S6--L-glutamate ligase
MIIHCLVFSYTQKLGANTKANINLLQKAAAKMGHELRIIFDSECQMKFGHGPELVIKNHEQEDINIVVVRPNPSGKNLEFRSLIIKQFELMGIPILNNYLAVMRAKNKLKTIQVLSQKKIPLPKTYIVSHSKYIDDIVADMGSFPVILKTVSGSHGQGVSIIESKRGLKSIIEMLTKENDHEPIIIQEYVKESSGKDVRVFIVGKKIVGAMERIATRRGEFRSNFHLGGRVRIAALSEEEKLIAHNAIKACGLDIAGIDIIRTNHGPKILEVNANPGLEGITKATGRDIAGEIIKYAVKKYKKLKNGNNTVINY